MLGEGDILTATENGFGKRTPVDEYPTKGRGGMGVLSIRSTDRNGAVIGAVQVNEADEIMLITRGGTLVRTRVDEVSVMSRNTQGVKLISLADDEALIGIERLEILEGEDDELDVDLEAEEGEGGEEPQGE